MKIIQNKWHPFFISGLFIAIALSACNSWKLLDHDFPKPVDTSDRPIEYQEKKIFAIESQGIFADNRFQGARLNDFRQVNDTLFSAVILPENQPINPSPHYAFRIWSNAPKKIYVQLEYPVYGHRYYPKLSKDKQNWVPIDSNDLSVEADYSKATLRINVSPDTLWIAAQELMTSSNASSWSIEKAKHQYVKHLIVGQSELGRDLHCLDISDVDPKKKETIVIYSRQHPPEVTGYIAMQSFVETLLDDSQISKDFRKKYRILVYPMLNPDGVDLGHWRHNSGGIDLNRDWAFYRQGETRTVANHLINTVKKAKNKVILGFDFHSTQRDIYYTLSDDLPSVIHGFKDYWLQGIDATFPGYVPRDSPDALSAPITKTWFYKQFGAEGITYEVGDETPRAFVKAKASTAAIEMMQLLILRE